MDVKTFDKYEKRGTYHWDWYASNHHGYADKVDLILSQLPNNGTVLDIGGGDGLISYKAFEKGLTVTCIDSNEHAIQLAQRKFEEQIYRNSLSRLMRNMLHDLRLWQSPKITRYQNGEVNLIAASIFDLKIDQPFDFIVCHEVIEHIQEPKRLLDFIYSNIKQFAIISTPDVTNRPPHELDYHSWTAASFAEFLSGYNFEFLIQDGYDIYVKLYN
ncbi:MAG: class I SAM-dependent methyltransferase [Anaerolineales bacterium]|nr:class I SAM-dependent methyltransferase [Anaerolineales bacterium]